MFQKHTKADLETLKLEPSLVTQSSSLRTAIVCIHFHKADSSVSGYRG